MALLSLIGPATKLIGKFVKDKDLQQKLSHDIATMAEKHAQQLALQQIEVNKVFMRLKFCFIKLKDPESTQ